MFGLSNCERAVMALAGAWATKPLVEKLLDELQPISNNTPEEL